MNETHSLLVPELATGIPLDTAVQEALSAERFELTGAQGGGLAPFLVRLQRRRSTPVVVLTADPKSARSVASDLSYHSGEDGVLLFPAYSLGPYDELTPDRRSTLQRAGVLFRLLRESRWRFLVISADSLSRRVAPLSAFEERCLPIVAGERMDRDRLIGGLETGGYYRTPLVEEPGTYAVRGSLVDLFPSYLGAPVRIDFFGSEIERIREFDPESQTGGAILAEVWIHPLKVSHLIPDEETRPRVAERMRSVCDAVNQPTRKTEALIADMNQGRPIFGGERFAPCYHDRLGTLFDYLPRGVALCIEDGALISHGIARQHAALLREYDRAQGENRPCFPPERYALTAEDLMPRLGEYPRVEILPLPMTEAPTRESAITDLRAESFNRLSDRLRSLLPVGQTDLISPLSRYLQALTESGYRTTVVAHTTGQADRIAAMLSSRGLTIHPGGAEALRRPGISVDHGELARGCLLPGDALAWIAEEEIFGRRTRRGKHRARTPKTSFDDLKSLRPGDLVVHLEHGIGRYDGLVRQRIRDADMDFLLIAYRGGDKLYLPVYRLNQVQKYRGGAPNQLLDKLGGQTFAVSIAKAKKATSEMAGKLLTLYAARSRAVRTPFAAPDDLFQAFEAGFPFEETDDQARAIDETMADMGRERPMDRLVCGDVGFGKTEVALRAAFRAAMSGTQTAVLVPTTVLAQQHFQTFEKRFDPYPVRIEMLSRFASPARNREIVRRVKEGTVDIVIGTHRLLSKDVHFKDLGLLIVDEEHRFGVAHKERIRALRTAVDTLVLTATPIPRTLQMAFSGIRDLSLIGTAPALRRPIKTMVCNDDPKILTRAIEKELGRGGQVFFVHNRVRDILKVVARVQRMAPEARVAVGHGQMKESELEAVMLDFVSGRYDILVCTTIIESGLDIPRANTIIIDRADTFGMAQLYQLRGRVGRSSEQAYAYLVVPPLTLLSDDAKERVETLARYTELGSGFSVATMDMELRGAGNLIGEEQSGNVAAVGIEMFMELLEEASSDLRGEPRASEVEPELSLESPGYIPEEYVPDVGQRLQLYKQLASAEDESEVERIAATMVDRLGPLPGEVEALVAGMVAKAICRQLNIRGLEVTGRGMIGHLSVDSRVNPDRVLEIIREDRGLVQLTEDLKIKVRFEGPVEDTTKSAIRFLHRLEAYDNNCSIS